MVAEARRRTENASCQGFGFTQENASLVCRTLVPTGTSTFYSAKTEALGRGLLAVAPIHEPPRRGLLGKWDQFSEIGVQLLALHTT